MSQAPQTELEELRAAVVQQTLWRKSYIQTVQLYEASTERIIDDLRKSREQTRLALTAAQEKIEEARSEIEVLNLGIRKLVGVALISWCFGALAGWALRGMS